ncbi:hypothetical protein KQI18_01595 [Clostridioides mangenotii]|uniref:hypothetical protein n=1 Tax=Metaclostridioides mangenotii TaxID=1540 RepID=UPI001C10D731|nr:hypothetical protein [Clostridioides mangenotii]MBU5306468.1 hypothetical protein [Clostridioides mangenotii]
MKFLGNLEQIKDNKYKVGLIHYKPELLQDTSNGILVDKLPEPTQQDGKVAVLYIDLVTKESFYEYEDIPKSEEDEIEILKKQVADLYFMQLQGGTN